MLTTQEKALIRIFKELKLDMETAMWIMLQLKETKHGFKLLIEFLRKSSWEELTTQTIIEEVERINEIEK